MSISSPAKVAETFLCIAGEMFMPTVQGALWWPSERTLVISDLHLEKGSSFASCGQLLPPYDTSSTLGTVEALINAYRPETVVSLGDSFHDAQAERRLGRQAITRIRHLTGAVDWRWVEGNHDPNPPAHLGGRGMKEFRKGSCVFRHEPTGEVGEIAGHLHPVARVAGRGRTLRRKCFVTDGASLILPSMGALTGGLNVLDPNLSDLFEDGAMVFAINGTTVHHVKNTKLRPDRFDEPHAERNWRL